MQIIIDIDNDLYVRLFDNGGNNVMDMRRACVAIRKGTPLPKGHGRLGDLDELEQRISNFVERDANITDEYTVIRQRFIVDGIRQTQAIIPADKESEI